jgi:hypothetical protein
MVNRGSGRSNASVGADGGRGDGGTRRFDDACEPAEKGRIEQHLLGKRLRRDVVRPGQRRHAAPPTQPQHGMFQKPGRPPDSQVRGRTAMRRACSLMKSPQHLTLPLRALQGEQAHLQRAQAPPERDVQGLLAPCWRRRVRRFCALHQGYQQRRWTRSRSWASHRWLVISLAAPVLQAPRSRPRMTVGQQERRRRRPHRSSGRVRKVRWRSAASRSGRRACRPHASPTPSAPCCCRRRQPGQHELHRRARLAVLG